MSNIITADYNGTQVFFQDDAYLNATAIAKHFNKLPNEWLRLESTQQYIDLLSKKLNTEKSRILKTTRGINGGTWLHRRLAVPFARWLNVEFAIWCDEQIEKILIGQNQVPALPNNTNTTVDDRTGLRDAVNMLVSKKGLLYSDAYQLVHHRFNVKSIEELSKEQLPQAVEYVHKVILEGELIEPKRKNMVEIPYDVADALVRFHRFVVSNAKKTENAFRAIHEAMGYERYIRNDLAADNFDIHNEFNHWLIEFEKTVNRSHRVSLLGE